jgi:hypothetical protein
MSLIRGAADLTGQVQRLPVTRSLTSTRLGGRHHKYEGAAGEYRAAPPIWQTLDSPTVTSNDPFLVKGKTMTHRQRRRRILSNALTLGLVAAGVVAMPAAAQARPLPRGHLSQVAAAWGDNKYGNR